jgi:hypothetical protein
MEFSIRPGRKAGRKTAHPIYLLHRHQLGAHSYSSVAGESKRVPVDPGGEMATPALFVG